MADVQLLGAYLINGEDDLKRETVLKRLKARLATMGDMDFNSDVFDGATATGADIVAACNTMPFGSDKRLVVVNAADALKKADSEALVDYLAAPADFTVLALVSRKLAKNTRLYKAAAAVGKQAVIDCAPKTKRELPSTVRSMATSHGITLTPDAADLLVQLVGENTVRLDAELTKLALAHASNQPIGASEVDALVERSAEAKPWDFTDAFMARDVAKCLTVYKELGASVYSMLPRCVECIRQMLTAHALSSRGQSGASALAKQLKMPDWKARKVLDAARKWRGAELRAALSSARDCEQGMKSGLDAQGAFLDWVVSTAAKPAVRNS